MNNSWAFDLENKFYTIIKHKTETKLKTKYPNINYTTTASPKDGDTRFPTVYMHSLSLSEKGMTTEGKEVQAVTFGMQVECYTNKSQSEANAVITEIAFAFKELGFEINKFPEIDNGSAYRSVMRVKRTICGNDTF